MGLDMLLTKETIIPSRDYDDNHNYVVTVKDTGNDYNDVISRRVTSVTETIAQWRKDNQIHGWFVRNLQNDIDDCGKYVADKDTIEKLYMDLGSALYKKNNEKAEKLFPPTEGFFFGGNTMDEVYWGGLKYTYSIVKIVLEEMKRADNNNSTYYYISSW